jgi:hypothetical protein
MAWMANRTSGTRETAEIKFSPVMTMNNKRRIMSLILIDLTKPSATPANLLADMKTEAEFINVQFP